MDSDQNSFLPKLTPPKDARLQFQVEGVLFQVQLASAPNGVKLQIWAELGPLPFSEESVQRRRMLIAVLQSARSLHGVRLGLNNSNQMIVSGDYDMPDIEPPEFIFVPVIAFMQKALPYTRLIGACLQAPTETKAA